MLDRAAVTGTLLVLRIGSQLGMLPLDIGRKAVIMCRHRLRHRQEADVWDRLHCELLRRLRLQAGPNAVGRGIDSASRAAKKGGDRTGPNPTDCGRIGARCHFASARNGTPLTIVLTGANIQDSTPFEELRDSILWFGGKPGRERRRPDTLDVGKVCDHSSAAQLAVAA